MRFYHWKTPAESRKEWKSITEKAKTNKRVVVPTGRDGEKKHKVVQI
jgi:hypothetical protein